MELAVNEVFGYGSVPIDLVNENRDLFIEAMRRNKWHCVKGTLVIGFMREKPSLNLEFGESLDKKKIKQLVKEQKQHHEAENSLSS